MKDRIIEDIVEIRKINGVITMGIQNLDFLDRVSNANTFIGNMSNYIVFPKSNNKNLDRFKVDLSRLGDYLRVFSSCSDDVTLPKHLKITIQIIGEICI